MYQDDLECFGLLYTLTGRVGATSCSWDFVTGFRLNPIYLWPLHNMINYYIPPTVSYLLEKETVSSWN